MTEGIFPVAVLCRWYTREGKSKEKKVWFFVKDLVKVKYPNGRFPKAHEYKINLEGSVKGFPFFEKDIALSDVWSPEPGVLIADTVEYI